MSQYTDLPNLEVHHVTLRRCITDLRAAISRKVGRIQDHILREGHKASVFEATERLRSNYGTLDAAERALDEGNEAWARRLIEAADNAIYY